MVMEPPAIYERPYEGPVVIHQLSASEIIKACNKGPNVLACSLPPIRPGGACIVFLPRVGVGGVGPQMRALLERWENARCNGWKDNSARVY